MVANRQHEDNLNPPPFMADVEDGHEPVSAIAGLPVLSFQSSSRPSFLPPRLVAYGNVMDDVGAPSEHSQIIQFEDCTATPSTHERMPVYEYPHNTEQPDRVSSDGRLRILHATSTHRLVSDGLRGQFMDLRFKVATEENWQTGNTKNDFDRYDSSPATHYALSSRKVSDGETELQELVAGARFTEVPSVEESLTYHMMRENPIMQRTISAHPEIKKVNELARRGRAFDLTRWMTHEGDKRFNLRETMASLIEIMGAGLAIAQAKGTEEEVAWFFLTNSKMERMLRRAGVDLIKIDQGTVTPGDTTQCSLCVVYPYASRAKMIADERYAATAQAVDKAAASVDMRPMRVEKPSPPKRLAQLASFVMSLIF